MKERVLQGHESLRKPGKYISKASAPWRKMGSACLSSPIQKDNMGTSVPHILSLHRHQSHTDPFSWMESRQLYTTDPSEAFQAAPQQRWPEAA